VLDREVKVAYTAAGWDEEAVQAKIDALTKPR